MYIYPSSLFSGADGAQQLQTVQHSGTVRTIDFNPFQPNLLASGAAESEIFIWDLNNPDSPMSPGNKIHPLEDISGVAWNRQVYMYIVYTVYIHVHLYYMCKIAIHVHVMVGPDKPAIPGQWLFRAC